MVGLGKCPPNHKVGLKATCLGHSTSACFWIRRAEGDELSLAGLEATGWVSYVMKIEPFLVIKVRHCSVVSLEPSTRVTLMLVEDWAFWKKNKQRLSSVLGM